MRAHDRVPSGVEMCSAASFTSMTGRRHSPSLRRRMGYSHHTPITARPNRTLELAVAERVHGVDDDRLDAAPRAVPQDVIDDRDEVGQALPGPGAGRQDVRA